jgi:hypothetical protein
LVNRFYGGIGRGRASFNNSIIGELPLQPPPQEVSTPSQSNDHQQTFQQQIQPPLPQPQDPQPQLGELGNNVNFSQPLIIINIFIIV